MSELLKATDVSVHAGAEMLVEPVSLALTAGRPFTLLGETGSGKSLLAQAIIGTLPAGLAAAGQVTLAGRALDLARRDGHRALWGRLIGVLPQEPWLSLDPLMPARAQIAEGHAFVRGLSWAEANAAADRDLAGLGLQEAADRRPDQLSGGMAQRVAFAAARAGGARIVVADEPTKGLDIGRRDEVTRLLLDEVAAGGALLTITHDLGVARRLGGELAVMLKGRVVERGPAAEVLAHPRHDYTRRLIAADPASWPQVPPRPGTGAPVLRAEGLSVSRGGRRLFDGLGLDLQPGEIVGIWGPSGCGKSTLGDVLLGLARPDQGRVTRGAGLAPQRFQKLYQDPPSAFPRCLALGRALDDLVRLHRLDGARIPQLMSRLRLSPALLARRPAEVSGGELQRLALLRLLLLDPVFLFADEPTSRLDLITQAEVTGLLTEVARETGMALLIVSHDPELLSRSADRVISLASPETAGPRLRHQAA
ncbi:ABC transporter ATP-binding protein [Paracoccus tibetensis]|uniref:Peptide/nickel transport system ATP-binding protein n=1 Tax=Paracoccus tibetensis TaxID=336292 RepID=A0A1G5I759_9RHOB|nr:ATP-binding cassette domain-containing protein [Paracoccus tibetensis]SCY71571.1 peptide/nickel transport system ATP-binding protein [Paracoccus tibetensis]